MISFDRIRGEFARCQRYALSAALVAVMYFATGCSDKHSSQSVQPVAACADDASDEVNLVKVFSEKPPTDDGKPGIPLSGIGDSAMRESNDIWVYAIKNGVFCMIHGDHAGENAQGSVEEIRGLKLSDSLAHTIPAATAQAVAQNLGTLCNKIWG